MPRTLRTAAVATLLLTLGACGLDDAEAGVADGLVRPVSDVDLVLSHEDATCVAETWVGQVGTQPFVEDGLVNRNLKVRTGRVRQALAGRFPVSRTTAEGYADGIIDCVDHDALSLERADDVPKPSAEQMDEYADCLRELDDDLWREGLAGVMMGDGSPQLDRARTTCEQELR